MPTWGAHRLNAITTLEVRQWLARLVTDKNLAATTVTRMLRILSALLQTAAENHGYLTANPARGVRPPRAKTPERRFLTVAELHHVADTIDGRYRSFVLFAGFSGLRFAELTALEVRDVNPLRGWVRVERTLTEVGGTFHKGGPKSTAGRRTIRLPPSIIEAVVGDLAGKTPGALVFTAPEGGPLRRTLFSKRFWKPALERAGLPPAGLHSLRLSSRTGAPSTLTSSWPWPTALNSTSTGGSRTRWLWRSATTRAHRSSLPSRCWPNRPTP